MKNFIWVTTKQGKENILKQRLKQRLRYQ